MVKRPGVIYENGRCSFTIWAPEKNEMWLQIIHPFEKKVVMEKDDEGYFTALIDNVLPDLRYYYQPDREKDLYPDPASYYQPEGVHKASAVVDHNAYLWHDSGWHGLPLKELIFYELHVGTFSTEGTFDAVIPRLKELKDIGVNAIELMPVAQFPGERNWGYDCVYMYAVQNSYGGPNGLKKLVDACHQNGIAVFLDVVYNHLGPEGNYLAQFAPYFTNKYHTPWGDAINYDDEWSDGVKEFFVQNICYWLEVFHIDGLRLDAIHTIFDTTAHDIWEFIRERIEWLQQKTGRTYHLIAESDFNSPRTVKPIEAGGQGFDAQWLDDFHHALYVLLHPEGKERYEDFGSIQQLAKAYKEGFVHSGEYVKFRKRRHGASSAGIPGNKFIVFNQNHDQVGNRPLGERLSVLVDFERAKLAAAAIILSPYIPLLFMGEEYADDAPFFYFVSHSDPQLIKAVREGRKKEFSVYKTKGEMPDPQNETTFLRSKLQWQQRNAGKHKIMLQWHQRLIRLRRSHDILHNFNKNDLQVNTIGNKGLVIDRQNAEGLKHLVILFNFSDQQLEYNFPLHGNTWRLLLHSKQELWMPEKIKGFPDLHTASNKFFIPPISMFVYESTA